MGLTRKKGGAVMRFAVAVALHRQYWLPDDPLYTPMQVGAARRPGWGVARDDVGENISEKNLGFSELTAQYWLWHNAEADVLGLCHYRRYFAARRFGPKKKRILTLAQAERLMQQADVLVPTPRIYAIETNYTQYIHAHHRADLDLTRVIIAERHPDFLPAYDRVMKRRWGRRFNMCIMRRAQFEAYSAWLFDILFELERRLDTTGYDARSLRVYGYVAERLMDVWLAQTRPRMKQLPVVNLESQHWPRKIGAFILRKIRYQKQSLRAQRSH